MGMGDTDPSASKPKNKGGRPRKHPVGARRPTLAFRVRGGTHEHLIAAARAADCSISEAIEDILSAHFQRVEERASNEPARKVAQAIETALRLAEMSSGSAYNTSQLGYDAAIEAIMTVIALMKRPDGYQDPTEQPPEGSIRALGFHVLSKESQRATAIGAAAGLKAIKWDRGLFEDEDDHDLVLLSRGRLGEEGYDRDAMLRHLKDTKTKPEVTSGDKK